ncbi:MAG TPA: YqhA family protein [Anaerolineae bacterium]|nr:YqhA family protein [Anaerolineae bacterium]
MLIRKIVASSRFLFIIAVVSTFILSVVTFVQGAVMTVRMIMITLGLTPLAGEVSEKEMTVETIQIVDVFLLATVFYIIALGLYALFIDENLPMPAWLEFHTFDDLKANLVGVIVVALSVLFLGKVIAWKGGVDFLFFGGAIALVIFALSYFLSLVKRKGKTTK